MNNLEFNRPIYLKFISNMTADKLVQMVQDWFESINLFESYGMHTQTREHRIVFLDLKTLTPNENSNLENRTEDGIFPMFRKFSIFFMKN